MEVSNSKTYVYTTDSYNFNLYFRVIISGICDCIFDFIHIREAMIPHWHAAIVYESTTYKGRPKSTATEATKQVTNMLNFAKVRGYQIRNIGSLHMVTSAIASCTITTHRCIEHCYSPLIQEVQQV